MQIRADDVHYTYPGGVKALDEVSLTIQPGEKVALVGENGSGKTTLARNLSGLLRPQVGRVWIGEWCTQDHSPAQIARRVGYVFQNPDEQLFHRRVWDEVAFGPKNLGFPAEQIPIMVENALELLNLNPAAQLNPRDLGYSTRKQVALSSVLAMQTPVLIFDEPTASLDWNEQNRLRSVIHTLHQEGKTILTISHDMDFIAENFDRVVLMWQGKIVLDAPAKEFFGNEAIWGRYGLIKPQIVRLGEHLQYSQMPLNIEQFLAHFEDRIHSSPRS